MAEYLIEVKIDNVAVYGVEESMVASGLSYAKTYNPTDFFLEVQALKSGNIKDNQHYKRALKLAKTPNGTGHDCFLKGCIVQFNVTISQVWFLQAERYRHLDIVTCSSKMHTMDSMIQEHVYHATNIDGRIVKILREMLEEGADNVELAKNCPMGIPLTARFSTNFMQLKTIYSQRKNHKLQEWRDFCKWIENLPYSELII